MKITELLVESQQLDEGPFTQAVGKVGGKIAKGVANVGKDLKTGFKAGYADQPTAAANTPSTPATNPAVTPAPKSGGIRGAIDQFKKGFAQGRGEPAADTTTAAASSNTAAPAADPKADAQSKVGVGQINKIIPTLRTRDLMSLKKNLDTVIAKKSAEKPVAKPAAAPTDDTPINPATGKPLTEPERAAHQAAGGQFDGETGAPLPLGTKAQNPPTDFEKKLTDLKAKRDAEKVAQAKPAAAPVAEPTGTGQAAAAAQAAGQDPEAAAKQAMAAKNPKLAAAMQQAGEMPATANKKAAPKKKAAPSQATIDADRERLMGRMSDSIERHKQHMVAEGLANGSIKIFKR
jgi:hypothetical protein